MGLDLGAAREGVRVARTLGTLPLLTQALARGELSYAKVRALTRVATPETEERLLAVGPARPPGSTRLAPEVGALLVQALAAARETLYQRRRGQDGDAGPVDVSAETPIGSSSPASFAWPR